MHGNRILLPTRGSEVSAKPVKAADCPPSTKIVTAYPVRIIW